MSTSFDKFKTFAIFRISTHGSLSNVIFNFSNPNRKIKLLTVVFLLTFLFKRSVT